MTAVIYARYSSDNQRKESIEGQLRECQEYAERNGITILRSYIDRALSAKTDHRPEFQRMIQDSGKGVFDAVLVWKLDRFSRDCFDSAHYKHILKKNGVKVISAKESISEGPEGIILEAMLEGMVEYYSAELAQKVNRGMHENALKGISNGGTIPLGYLLGLAGMEPSIVTTSAARQSGGRAAIKKDQIERAAVLYTVQRVFNDKLIERIADELVALQRTENTTLPVLRNQLADTNRGIENMLNAIQQGVLTSSTKQRLEELENLREELKTSILQAELERPQYTREDIIAWIGQFKNGDPNDKAYQRQIIDTFINSIYVFDDRLVFTCNYKNGTQTVSFTDISAVFGADLKPGVSPFTKPHRRGKKPETVRFFVYFSLFTQF